MQLLYKESCDVTDRKLESLGEGLFHYIDHLSLCAEKGGYEFSESAINLPSDKRLLREIVDLAKEKQTPELKYIFLIGIGGSNLGAKALYEAMYQCGDRFSFRTPRMFFLDTINSRLLATVQKFIDEKIKDPKEFLVIITTKSGTTTETAVNAEIVFASLANKFSKKELYQRVVVITDRDSLLWKNAKEKNISILSIPKIIAGRNSVFSPTGLFPMSVAGLWDAELFLKKAEDMRNRCLSKEVLQHPALLSGLITYQHFTKGKIIANTFFFNSELESVGKWYEQLLAESIGKKHKKDGTTERVGITPITSIGSTDLHSMLQLYVDGPHDKMTTFVWFDRDENAEVPKEAEFNVADVIKGRTSDEVLSAIYGATKSTYRKEKLPFMEVVLEDFSDLGGLMQFKMIEVMYLAKLFGVNAFDQPAVEFYKKETKRLLEG